MSYKLLFPTYRARYRYVEERLRRLYGSPATRILHLGAGEGDVDPMLAQFASEVVSCDINADDVARAAERNRDIPNVRYAVEDALALSFADASFDGVVCLEVIEHVGDPQRLLAEIRRVLRPGGLLLLTCPSHDFPITYDPLNSFVRRHRSPFPVGAYAYGHSWLVRSAEVRTWAAAHGFDVEEETRLSHHLAGAIECYVPGLLQRVLKRNAGNRAGTARRRGLNPSRTKPAGVGLTDWIVDLDERLFGESERSVGLGYVFRG